MRDITRYAPFGGKPIGLSRGMDSRAQRAPAYWTRILLHTNLLRFGITYNFRHNVRMKKKTIDVRIDYELYLELMKLRDKIGIPVSESLRRAIREYIAKQEKQANGNSESL
jgi:hypothetical protein